DVTDGGLDLRATSLVYTTLLSLAPLLAVSFSVLKAFGAHNQMRPLLLQMVAPLGPQGAELTDRLIGFVNNLEVGVLGFTGFALLFWTVLSLLQKIEDSFNHIWRVQKSRSLRRRFSEYLSVLMVGPVLVFSALGLMASMTSHGIVQAIIALEPFGTLYFWLGKLLPTLFISIAFAFLYAFLPNTLVSLRAALTGGIAAGVAWRLTGGLFAEFVAGSTQYAAIYSSFAILIVFMIWLYVSWLILLLGVDVSFYAQHPRYLRMARRETQFGQARFRRVGLWIMALLAERFWRGEPPWTLAELTARLDLPDLAIADALERLRERGLVLPVEGSESAWVPAREPCVLMVADILAALEAEPGDDTGQPAAPVDGLLERLNGARNEALGEMSLKALVESGAGTHRPDQHGGLRHTADST
ncbi:YhjD/YihY/BrkB family envelope integrity protein, partial [Methylomagnum sp.]